MKSGNYLHEVYENINYVISVRRKCMGESILDTAIIFKLQPESVINVLRIYVFKFVMFNYVISDVPRFAGSLRTN